VVLIVRLNADTDILSNGATTTRFIVLLFKVIAINLILVAMLYICVRIQPGLGVHASEINALRTFVSAHSLMVNLVGLLNLILAYKGKDLGGVIAGSTYLVFLVPVIVFSLCFNRQKLKKDLFYVNDLIDRVKKDSVTSLLRNANSISEQVAVAISDNIIVEQGTHGYPDGKKAALALSVREDLQKILGEILIYGKPLNPLEHSDVADIQTAIRYLYLVRSERVGLTRIKRLKFIKQLIPLMDKHTEVIEILMNLSAHSIYYQSK
jgi:hypothetical protein